MAWSWGPLPALQGGHCQAGTDPSGLAEHENKDTDTECSFAEGFIDHQRVSLIIRVFIGHQRATLVIRGQRWSSEDVRGHQR